MRLFLTSIIEINFKLVQHVYCSSKHLIKKSVFIVAFSICSLKPQDFYSVHSYKKIGEKQVICYLFCRLRGKGHKDRSALVFQYGLRQNRIIWPLATFEFKFTIHNTSICHGLQTQTTVEHTQIVFDLNMNQFQH